MNLNYEFLYYEYPRISLEMGLVGSSFRFPTDALLDTGAEQSLFDARIAELIGLDLGESPSIRITGIGGEVRDAKLGQVYVQLLGQPQLSALLEVAFAPGVEVSTGNLLGLDALSLFDVALSHSNRIGYLGRAGA